VCICIGGLPCTAKLQLVQCERAMRKGAILSISIMIMPAILWARSDDIPNLDVRPVCRGIASQSASNPADVGIKTTFEQCIQSEQAVREQLKQAWPTFSAADKQHCISLATTGGESSNTELLTCLEMSRDVRALRPTENASSSTASTGQAPSLASPATVQPPPSDASASRSSSAKKAATSEVDSTLKELQRVKADAQNARTDAQNARASEALAQRKLADTQADLKQAKEEAARATKDTEQAKADAKAAREAKAAAERKLADAEAARSAAEERLKASESAAKNQQGFGAWLRGWFGRKPSNQ
jgi:DNA repair exonuclease SbcCD ATPase subunit